MHMSTVNERDLIAKIKSLLPEKIAVVDDFVEFLHHRVEKFLLSMAAAKMSEKSFQAVWGNPEDAEYDNL